jgi:hypothetical protein
MELCSICGRLTGELSMVVGRGVGDEMVLCPRCAEVAFPGLADMMRHECPICSGQAAS